MVRKSSKKCGVFWAENNAKNRFLLVNHMDLHLRISMGVGHYWHAFQVDDSIDEYDGKISIRVAVDSVFPGGIEFYWEKPNTSKSVLLLDEFGTKR